MYRKGLRIGIVIVIALTRLEVSYNSIFFFFFFNWNQLTMTKLNEEYFTVATSANQMPTERYSIIRPVKQIQYWETLSNAVGATSQVNFNLKTR